MKKYVFLLGILCIAILMLFITDSYALFETDANGNKEIDIGKWEIILNETDISLARTLNITDFTFSNTSHTEDGYFAPGRTISFPIHIDVSNTEESVEYTIDIDDSALIEHPNIIFSFYDEDNDVELTSNHLEGVILLNNPSREKNLKINLEWNDELEYDEADTSMIGHDFDFTIHANFKQYIGE